MSAIVEMVVAASEVPDGWRSVVLSNVAEVNPETLRASTSPDFTFGYIDISQIDGPGQCAGWSEQVFGEAPSRARRKVQAGDILVSTVRPYLRSFAQVPQAELPLVASTGFAVVRSGAEADQQFLYQHILHENFIEHLKPRMTGSNYPAVSAIDVEAYPIALPPLDEQRRIAEVLRSVDEVIAAAQDVLRAERKVFGHVRSELLDRARGNFDETVVATAIAKNRGEKLKKLQTSDYQEGGAFPIVDQGASFICGYTDDPTAIWPYSLPIIVFGDHTRILKFVDFPFAIGADGTQCITPVPGLNPRYLYYALQSLDLRGEGYARHFKLLKERSIPMPDLPTQIEIAEQLLALEQSILAAEEVQQQLQSTKAAPSGLTALTAYILAASPTVFG